MRTAIPTLFLVVVLGACDHEITAARTVEGELGAVPASAARVCVLRPELDAADVTLELRDNGRLVGATRGATYVCWLAAPGEHQVTSADDTGPTLFVARPGAHYWIHQEMSLLATAGAHAHLDWVDDAAAAPMLDACRARVRVAIPGHETTDAVAVAPRRARER